jgi:GNAT superfamily N-acetyltransferase
MITISHEINEDQFMHQRALYIAWALEEGHEFSDTGWAKRVIGLTKAGQLCPVVAYCEGEAIGTVEFMYDADPFDGKVSSYGDHAYVVPEWRNAGVFQMLMDECEMLSAACGCQREIIPVAADDTEGAGFLRHYYEERGFKCSGFIMRRDR